MPAKIKTSLGEAEIKYGKWTSADEELEGWLNETIPYNVGGGEPNPDLSAAMRAIEALPQPPKAELISYTRVAAKSGDGEVIY